MDKFLKVVSLVTKKEVYGFFITVLIGIILYRFSVIILEKIVTSGKTEYERKKRKTIVELLKNIFKYIIVIIVILFILNLYGYDVKALVAGLGILATVLGLALQDTIKDFIGGITIIIENYFVAGDIVEYNGFTGTVIELTLKSTKIKAPTGNVLVISNRNINEVINLSQKVATVFVHIPIAYEEDVISVEKIINNQILKEINKIEGVTKNSSKYHGISKLASSSINYLISVDCKQDKRWQIERDILRTALIELNKNNIKIPYEQIEVHNAKD